MDPVENTKRTMLALEAFNRGDLEEYLTSYADDAVIHGLPAGYEPNVTGHRAFLTGLRRGLPDLRVIVDDIISEGDRVAVRLRYRGTHLGELRGVAPTGRQIEWAGMTFRRFGPDGLTVERWVLGDTLALLGQLGLGP